MAATTFPPGTTGYRMERLAAAFDRVITSRDWKGPIHAVIGASEREVTEQAILTFTGTPSRFIAVADDPDRLIVTALGYRSGQPEARNAELVLLPPSTLRSQRPPVAPAGAPRGTGGSRPEASWSDQGPQLDAVASRD